jgi:hypothetical protein
VNVSSYIDSLAAKGQYHFTTAEAIAALSSSSIAVRAAIRRLRGKARVSMPFRGFHLIVPPEYRALGCLPADQFILQLMEHLGLSYYAGLLSAASRHAKVHPARVVECFARYLEHDGLRISRAELQLNLHEKLSDETFLSDVKPLIALDTVWSFEDAAGYVQHEILPLLPGESWRGGKESLRGGPHGTAR